jgi:hypothetical protein
MIDVWVAAMSASFKPAMHPDGNTPTGLFSLNRRNLPFV